MVRRLPPVKTAASVTLASSVVYEPMANLVKSMVYGNGLNDFNTFTLDDELDVLGTYNGATSVINRAHTRTDALNLTNIFDNVTTANNQSYWASAANRLQNANGPWGAKTFYYDGVGNRTQEISTPTGGATTTDVLGYPSTSNRVVQVVRGTATRTLTYDNAGNLLSDNGAAGNKAYVYNKRNRLSQATVGALVYNYTYNALEQLVSRAQVSPATTTHLSMIGRCGAAPAKTGNVIAETAGGGATGTTGTTREYIYLYEAEIAPTMDSRTVVDRPLAVVSAVNTATPATYWVSVDHLNRPVKMTTSTKASVWDAIWQPWGGIHAITGSASLDARFPGQWFQTETGLHYNWHRSYDPTLGRYTQPDPLGFVDGPSVYGYAKGSPQRWVDRDGRNPSAIAIAGCLAQPQVCALVFITAVVVSQCSSKPVRKPAIPDVTPRDYCEELTLAEAKAGAGEDIMQGLADEPRLIAEHGPGPWIKREHKHICADGRKLIVHYFHSRTTYQNVELKFK
jgi:RHS repeat-associated protein